MSVIFREIDSIRAFIVVCETGSIRRAADVLHITQPAISRRILKLEDELGTSLFERSHHGIHLTEQGQILLDYARRIDRHCGDALSALREFNSGEVGSFSIGAGPAWCEPVMPAVISQLHKRFPSVKLSLVAGLNGTTMPMLVDNRIDVVVGSLEPEKWENHALRFQYVTNIGVKAYARTAHPLRSAVLVSPAKLLSYPWIGLSGSSVTHTQTAHYFRSLGLPAPDRILETNSLRAACRVLASGDFIIALPDSLTELLAGEGIEPLASERPIWKFAAGLTYRDDGLKLSIIHHLQSLLIEALASSAGAE